MSSVLALSKLYAENRRKFIFKVYPYTRNYDVAEDLVQEAFLKAFDKFSQYKPEKGSLKGWFVKILFSSLWDHMREQKKVPYMMHIDAALEAELSSYDDEADLAALLQTVKNPLHKKILTSKLVFGLSYKEVAGMQGVKEEGVRKIVERFRSNQ